MYAKEALFEEKHFELGDAPLFSNAAALARELISAGLYGTPGKERSLGSYLAQIITSNSRSAPAALRDAIYEAVARRTSTMAPRESERVVLKVQTAFARDEKVRNSSPMSAESLFDDLLELSDSSSIQFIVTARTAEDVRSERSSDLTQKLLQRTGLSQLAENRDRTKIDQLTAKSQGLPEVSYVFNVPTKAHAYSWWATLYTILSGKAIEKQGFGYDSAVLKEAINLLNEREVITVQAIPEEFCATPVVVFEPHRPSATGYVLFYHGPDESASDRVSVARMDPWSVGIWTRYAFQPIVEKRVKITPVRFSDTHT